MELGRVSITNDNDSKECAMNKNIRVVVIKCKIMMLRVTGRSVKCVKIAEWSLDVQ